MFGVRCWAFAFSLLISLHVLVEIDRPLTHQNRRPTNPRSRNHPGFLLRASDESTWAPHLHALRNPPAKHSARHLLMVSEETAHGAIRASSSRILRHAAQRREHPSADIEHAPVRLGLTHAGIQIHLRIHSQITKGLEPAHIDTGALQCRAIP